MRALSSRATPASSPTSTNPPTALRRTTRSAWTRSRSAGAERPSTSGSARPHRCLSSRLPAIRTAHPFLPPRSSAPRSTGIASSLVASGAGSMRTTCRARFCSPATSSPMSSSASTPGLLLLPSRPASTLSTSRARRTRSSRVRVPTVSRTSTPMSTPTR